MQVLFKQTKTATNPWKNCHRAMEANYKNMLDTTKNLCKVLRPFLEKASRIFSRMNGQQDGRLALAYFSPEYKNFDQHMQTVKNEITVYNLVSKGFLQASIPPLISIFYAKDFVQNFFVSVPKNFVAEHFGDSENFGYRKILCIRKGYHYFPLNFFCLTMPKNS